MKSPNCVAIMAILTEMVRRINEDIVKIDLKPLPAALDDSGTVKRRAASKARKA